MPTEKRKAPKVIPATRYRHSTAASTIFPYTDSRNHASFSLNHRRKRFRFRRSVWAREWARWEGRMKKASTMLTASTRIRITGMTLSTFPICPSMKAAGPKIQMVVKNEETTPIFTSPVPRMAAWSDDFPRSSWAAMFSAITMASSMRRPSARRRPTMVIMLME